MSNRGRMWTLSKKLNREEAKTKTHTINSKRSKQKRKLIRFPMRQGLI